MAHLTRIVCNLGSSICRLDAFFGQPPRAYGNVSSDGQARAAWILLANPKKLKTARHWSLLWCNRYYYSQLCVLIAIVPISSPAWLAPLPWADPVQNRSLSIGCIHQDILKENEKENKTDEMTQCKWNWRRVRPRFSSLERTAIAQVEQNCNSLPFWHRQGKLPR